MKNFGTAMLVSAINAFGALPTHNFRYGQFDRHDAISGDTMHDTIVARGGKPTHNCQPGCVIQCSQVYPDKDGNFLTSGIEYETIALMGANCELGDLDAVAMADRLMDDIGLDSIDTSCAFGVAMEAGILPFGDAEGVVRMLREEVAQGTPLGRILGGGAALVGKVYGMTRVPVAKGQAFPAYDPRRIKGIGITYATSPMGADHTAGYAVGATIGGHIDGLKKEGQIGLSKGTQIVACTLDSLGICLFSDMALGDNPECKPRVVDMINACVGGNRPAQECFDGLGAHVLQMEHEFNLKAGLGSGSDRLPEFLETDALPPHNGVWDFTGQEIDAFWSQ
jgi:aldehyde:ferredoxin oxidoreductase